MRVIISLLLLAFTVTYGQNKSKTISLVTFNVLHGANTNGKNNLDIIADIISSVHPDLVALQEVDCFTNRSKKRNIAELISKKTEMNYVFGKAIDYDDGEYGLAILSKNKIINKEIIKLPTSEGNEKRILLLAKTIAPWGDTLLFCNTHLDYKEKSIDRINQAKTLLQKLTANEYPTILSGDFNATPSSSTLSLLEEEFVPAYKSTNLDFTYPSNKPTRKIDYIMYKPSSVWNVSAGKVIVDSIASDHCAYWVKLNYKK